jgi:uncharacterized protein (DUF58 family)
MTDNNLDQRLKHLHLRTRYPVEHLLAGEYRSVFKGRGMDFDELREYALGDDVRVIDWNVTARVGHPYIRRYIEERELALWFLVDVSASMLTGTGNRTKMDAVQEITALLALAAARNNDRAGLILFSDRVEHILPTCKGIRHTMRLLNDLIGVQPSGRGSALVPALDCVGHLIHKRTLIIVISDFLFDCTRDQLGSTGFRHDLIAVAVNSPAEIIPPVCGLTAVADAESGEEKMYDFTDRLRREFAASFAVHRAYVKDEFLSVGADFMELTTESDCVDTLTLFFRNRLRRMQDEAGG